ncbi:heavy metal-binding domain-containing protein [Halomonas sp. NPDC076908]|uniref:heavy metal-binding domain-containing protein n=1 Tax=Halomonas sp. NPDC076908 TaxID=3390567 RepID=UPI003D079DEE
MHPEVVSDQPGDCPKCGMHLVPVGSDDSQTHDGHGHGASAPAHGGKYDKVPAGHAGADQPEGSAVPLPVRVPDRDRRPRHPDTER